jgi:hypothetical protein
MERLKEDILGAKGSLCFGLPSLLYTCITVRAFPVPIFTTWLRFECV